jgi:phenylacetic acid degradation operon negative regulatory protein
MNKNEFEIRLTEKGLARVLQDSFQNMKIRESKNWDGYWRVIVFDIPDRHKWAREGFREKLKNLNFYQLQKSVFVAPYPCEKMIEFLISVFSINSYVRLIETQDLSDDLELKKFFAL